MDIVCLDMEGVLTPEIWIAVAERLGIPELKRTTRDEPDYDKLMRYRLGIMAERGIRLPDIQKTIRGMDPLPGAVEFLDRLRDEKQVVIVSDTYDQFVKPLLRKMNHPTIFCHTLDVADDGTILDYRIRGGKSKCDTVRGLQAIGFETIACGDSYNDLDMIQASRAGFFFRTTDALKAAHPEIPAFETYEDLLHAILTA